jgi:hypothetical protein
MNFSRYLPIIIALLGVFVVLGGWKAGQRFTGHPSKDNPFSDQAPAMVRMAVQAVASSAEANVSASDTNGSAASASKAARPQNTEAGEPRGNETDEVPGQMPAPEAGLPGEPAETAAKASPVVQAKKPETRNTARVFVEGYSQNRTLFTVRVAASADIPSCSWFTLEAPPRIVVDVRGRWECPGAPVRRVGPGMIKTVVVGEHPTYLRLVLRLGKTQGFPAFALDERKREVLLIVRQRNSD